MPTSTGDDTQRAAERPWVVTSRRAAVGGAAMLAFVVGMLPAGVAETTVGPGDAPAGTALSPRMPAEASLTPGTLNPEVLSPLATVADVSPQPGSSFLASPVLFTTAGPDARVQIAIAFAMAQLGVPYVWGGDGPASGEGGFDCSGLTTAAYAAAGIRLPRTAQTQFDAGPHVPADAELMPGDLVFYGTPDRVHHVGLYLGDGKMVNAPRRGKPVQVAYIRWPGDDYLGATRPAALPGSLRAGFLPVPPVTTVPAAPPAPGAQPDDFVAPVAPVPVIPLPVAPEAAAVVVPVVPAAPATEGGVDPTVPVPAPTPTPTPTPPPPTTTPPTTTPPPPTTTPPPTTPPPPTTTPPVTTEPPPDPTTTEPPVTTAGTTTTTAGTTTAETTTADTSTAAATLSSSEAETTVADPTTAGTTTTDGTTAATDTAAGS